MEIYHLQKIETPRIILRPLQIGDEVPLYDCINYSLESLKKWMPWAKNSSLATTRDFVHAQAANWKAKIGNNFPMVVIEKPTKNIIGASGFTEDSLINKGIYTIGYWLDIRYRGQGLVTEFVNGLTRYAIDHLRAQAVHIRIHQDNNKSIAVANRLKFISTPISYQEGLNLNTGNRPTKEDTLLFIRNNISLLPPLDVKWYG